MPAEHPEGFAGSSSEISDLVTHYATAIRLKIDSEIPVTMTIEYQESGKQQNGWMIYQI